MLFGVACATSSIFYPNDRYKDTPSPFIYDKTKKNTKCLTYLKNHREPMPFYLPGLHSRIYKNHRHKMIRHTKLIDHILRLPSLDATLQSYPKNHHIKISTRFNTAISNFNNSQQHFVFNITIKITEISYVEMFEHNIMLQIQRF